MPLPPEVLKAHGEVVAWLGSLDVSFATEEEPWFTVGGIESPRQIGSDLHEMRRAADALEATLDDEDDVNEAREQIRRGLDLPEANDPVGALYDAVAASDAVVRATDGSPFTTLFNRFSIDNSPMLRNPAA
ncbi:hypothetical protein ACFQX9_31860 [Bradyrhizobium sp. GCM10028915]|uniref:hypothetical protein n=1 Tax=Bradyrhizobium sp. GCM10028915 TaxID=3273385 RepID=UPI00360B1F3E